MFDVRQSVSVRRRASVCCVLSRACQSGDGAAAICNSGPRDRETSASSLLVGSDQSARHARGGGSVAWVPSSLRRAEVAFGVAIRRWAASYQGPGWGVLVLDPEGAQGGVGGGGGWCREEWIGVVWWMDG